MREHHFEIQCNVYGESEIVTKAILQTVLDLFDRNIAMKNEITHVEVGQRGLISSVFRGVIVRIEFSFSKTSEFLWIFSIKSGNRAVCYEAWHLLEGNFLKHLKKDNELEIDQMKKRLEHKKLEYYLL